jgi:hypothetical protein
MELLLVPHLRRCGGDSSNPTLVGELITLYFAWNSFLQAAEPKPLKHDEWMLVPPKSTDLLGCSSGPFLPPLLLTDCSTLLSSFTPQKRKPRQFARSAAPAKNVVHCGQRCPPSRQQRIADEIRVRNAVPRMLMTGRTRRRMLRCGGRDGGMRRPRKASMCIQ